MLELGYTVAHTAYVKKAFDDAQVIADTPIFTDYQKLDQQYPNSRFIYLTRDASLWVPSIKQLLNRMSTNVLRSDGGFNPTIKRCFTDVFNPYELSTINHDEFLMQCYKKHQQEVMEYFKERECDLLTINISHSASYSQLLNFLHIDKTETKGFQHLNKGAKVTEWKGIKHPLKIESTKNGRIELL